MENRYTLTIYVAAPGTPTLKDGEKDTSTVGHVYYSISDGNSKMGWGFAPTISSPIWKGKVVDNEFNIYQNPVLERTMEITKQQYDALKDFGLEYDLSDVQKWYNGYLFGDSKVYNPWSIINFLDEKKLRPYWIGVSGNKTIYDLLGKADKKVIEDLEKLFVGKTVYKAINEYMEYAFNASDIWELFLYSGYLTTDGEKKGELYPLRLPNKEIQTFFRKIFIDRFVGNYTQFSNIVENLKNGKIEEFAKGLQDEILSSLSYFDTEKDEKYYKIFLIGIFIILENDYIRLSERESGYGRADLVLEPKNKINPAYIFEFKAVNNEDELENYAKTGFEQIKEKEYDVELRNRGTDRIVCVGLAFYRKKIKMKYEIMEK